MPPIYSRFIKPQLLAPNLRSPVYEKKIKINKNDVSLQFLLARDVGSTYKVSFIVMLNPRQRLEPGIMLSPRNVDMVSLREAIIAKIDPYDRIYMKIGNFDTRKAEFSLDVRKWLNDTTRGMRVSSKYTKFGKTFRLSKAPPKMILMDPLRIQWSKFVTRNFKEYIEKNRGDVKYFKYLIPDSVRRRIRGAVRNMFDWEYDIQWNEVNSRMKTVWIMALLVGTGLAISKMRESDLVNRNTKELFATKVQKNLKKFNHQTFAKYMRSKGFPV